MRVTAGSSVNMVDTLVSQNLVQGTGAPVRGAATNNAKLWRGRRRAPGRRRGARILQRNNIVNNSYGVFNVGLDGTTANTAVPVTAENNWWGLRARHQRRNNGPGDLADHQPADPGEPGQRHAGRRRPGDTSDAVDFFPFRNGPQSDPQTGEFAVIDVPGPVNDAAPT